MTIVTNPKLIEELDNQGYGKYFLKFQMLKYFDDKLVTY